MIKIVEDLVPEGRFGSNTRLISMQGVTIHDTGNTHRGANARNQARYLKTSTREASWHFAVDDHEVVQSVPIDRVTWHCGRAHGNQSTVSIEICVNSDGDLIKATDNAAELTAKILTDAGLSADGHIFQHHDWSGKDCPAQLRAGSPYTWQEFIDKVKKHMEA